MSIDLTIYATDTIRKHGNVVIASDDSKVCAMYENGDDTFAVLHQFEKPGRVELYFNETDGKQVFTRKFEVDPIELSNVLTRLVRECKDKKEESFI